MPVESIKANGYNLDIKNPHTVEESLGDPDELLEDYQTSSPSSPRRETL